MTIKNAAGTMARCEKANGWVIIFEDGKRQFMRGISSEGAQRVANGSGRAVYAIRSFIFDPADRSYIILN